MPFEQVMASQRLRLVAAAALAVGNALIDRSDQGTMLGVRLESLIRLSDVRVSPCHCPANCMPLSYSQASICGLHIWRLLRSAAALLQSGAVHCKISQTELPRHLAHFYNQELVLEISYGQLPKLSIFCNL